jgi:hypothetical protein
MITECSRIKQSKIPEQEGGMILKIEWKCLVGKLKKTSLQLTGH